MAREGLFDDSGYKGFDSEPACAYGMPCESNGNKCCFYDGCEMRYDKEDTRD